MLTMWLSERSLIAGAYGATPTTGPPAVLPAPACQV